MNVLRTLALLALLSFPLLGATPKLLNIDFGNAAVAPAPTGPAAIGADGDRWNLSSQPFIPNSHLDDLVYADGSASGVGMSVSNAPGAWVVPGTPPMFSIYAYSYGGPITVTLTNLMTGVYELYAYGHGERNDLTTSFNVEVADRQFGELSTENSNRYQTQPWQEGAHYVVFREVEVVAGERLTLTASGVAGGSPFLNGLQIRYVRALTTPPATKGDLLNVDFGNAAVAPAPVGPAAIGAPGDFWNLSSQPFIPNSSMTNLVLADGTRTGIGMSVSNAPGAWVVPGTPPMFVIYAYSHGGPIVVTLTNVPTGTYDLYLYGHGEGNAAATAFEVTAAGVDHGRKATAQAAGWQDQPYVEGTHYVLYRGLAVTAEKPLRITALAVEGQSTPYLNGLQLVRSGSTPRPLAIQPLSTTFTNSLRVEITGGPAGSTVYYTLDGTEPLPGSTVYSSPLILRSRAELKARAFVGTNSVSETVSAEYVRLYPESEGLTKEWRRRHFGDGYIADPRSLAEADPDGDGADNLREFVAGTDPVDGLSGFAVSVRQVPAITWRSIAGKTYRIMRRESLSAGSWELFRQVTAEGDSTRLVDADADRTWFYAIEPVR